MTSDINKQGINTYGKLENVQLTLADWTSRWEHNEIGFHLPQNDPYLLKHENVFLEQKMKIFLPLCGKSNDLVYLSDKGHDVFGCEFVEKSVIDFFTENSLEYVSETKKFGTCNINEYKAKSKKITIYQGDFFALTSQYVGKFDAIWDRASLVAIHPLKRK